MVTHALFVALWHQLTWKTLLDKFVILFVQQIQHFRDQHQVAKLQGASLF
jgi:hypothetical protein